MDGPVVLVVTLKWNGYPIGLERSQNLLNNGDQFGLWHFIQMVNRIVKRHRFDASLIHQFLHLCFPSWEGRVALGEIDNRCITVQVGSAAKYLIIPVWR